MSAGSDGTEDDRIVAKCYVELAYVTKEKGEYDESLRYHRKSLDIFERIDDALSVADSHLNIAEVYKAKGELKQAMSEYEKGLTLYEEVYVDDGTKNSDSGTDVSLNSSSYCDLQHTRSLSKSDEVLQHVSLINNMDKNASTPPRHPISGVLNTSTSSLNLRSSSTRNIREVDGISQLTTSIDDSALILSKKLTDKLLKSLSSSRTSDLQNLDDPDLFLPLSSSDLTYETAAATTPDDTDMIEICAPFLSSFESTNQHQLSFTADLSLFDTKLEEIDNSNQVINCQERKGSTNKNQADLSHRLWHRLPDKQLLIIILIVFLIGAFCRSLYETNSDESPLPWSSRESTVNINSRSYYAHDELSKQLRKILTWRKSQVASLDKESRRAIEEFLTTNSDGRTKMTVDKFQKILEMLDLKVALVPR